MQEKQKLPPIRIAVNDYNQPIKPVNGESQNMRNSSSQTSKPQLSTSYTKKSQRSSSKCCLFPDAFKRQMLRLIFIPLLIVLFLLTIALTFKQNNYQTNDYFYSKNIEINRKIRGVVPPLNETKENIFGQYTIGLTQKFNIESRRRFQGWKAELWKNQSMRITQIGKNGLCWATYKLKFYSSTIFIRRIQNHIYVDSLTNATIRNLQNQTSQQNTTISDLAINPESDQKTQNTARNDTEGQQHTNRQNSGKADQDAAQDMQKSICSMNLWQSLNQILYESHIWTFAQKNFYLLEFSQLGDNGNGVLIMKMIQNYISSV